MSMLFYEAARSPGQAEGCIYGEKAVETTQQITDSSVSTMKENILCKYILECFCTNEWSFFKGVK